MTIGDMLLPEFEQEMANTRTMLDRVPLNKSDWKPHEKSMTLGRLAGHIAELPLWTGKIVDTEMIDLAPVVTEPYKPYIPNSSEDLLQEFDMNVAKAREVLKRASDEHYTKVWSLQVKGEIVASGSRLQMIHVSLSHIIHHRAQLGVYLRLNGIPLPPVYGPSADEGF